MAANTLAVASGRLGYASRHDVRAREPQRYIDALRTYEFLKLETEIRELLAEEHAPTMEQRRELAAILTGGAR